MKKNKKILLRSSSSFGFRDEDIYLDLSLNRTNKQIKKDSFNNDFDLQNQFDKERNSSRNFFVYGFVDSVVDLGDDFKIDLYKESKSPNPTFEEDLNISSVVDKQSVKLDNGAELQFIKSMDTNNVNYKIGNLFGAPKKSYGELLENYSGTNNDVIYFFIKGNLEEETEGPSIPDQIFRQRLVFFDDDGNFVNYGSDTVEIRDDGTTFDINNDFPFFYDMHWIKNVLYVRQTTNLVVNFDEDKLFSIEGSTVNLSLSLDQPSKNGNEYVRLVLKNVTTSSEDYSIDVSDVTWSVGEQTKVIPIKIKEDELVENVESFEVTLADASNLIIGNKDKATIDIFPEGVKNKTIYNFQGFYKNLLSFGKVVDDDGSLDDEFKNSVLRHGYFFGENDPESFYPNDDFFIEIKNSGNITILPKSLGLFEEDKIFQPGESIFLNLSNQYQTSNSLHKIQIRVDIPEEETASIVFINGFIFEEIRTLEDLELAIDELGEEFYFSYNLEFETELDEFGEEVLDEFGEPIILDKWIFIESIKSYEPIISRDMTSNENFSIIEEIPFESVEQIPFSIELTSNMDNGNTSFYEFVISKNNPELPNDPSTSKYREVVIPGEFLSANENPNTFYLTSEYSNINRPYGTEDCVDPGIITTPGSERVGNATVNGLVFLASENNLTQSLNHEFRGVITSVENCTKEGGTNNFLGGFKV